MSALPVNFHPEMARLGWALIHLLWQGLAVAVALELALLVAGNRARLRYFLCGVALASLPVCFVLTYGHLGHAVGVPMSNSAPEAIPVVDAAQALGPMAVDPLGANNVPQAPSGTTVPVSRIILPRDWNALVPYLPWAWLAGVLILGVRKAGGLVVLSRLRRHGVTEPDDAMMELFRCACARIGVDPRRVSLKISKLVRVPMTMGWLSPIVLFPAALASGLSTGEIELILAHELAHVRRWDYLVNLLQAVVETLFFYHPLTWWISRRMRQERENCCDDLVVSGPQEKLAYVRALLRLEELRAPGETLASAATGGVLLRRIERLVNDARVRPANGAVVLLIIVTAFAGLAAHSAIKSQGSGPDALMAAKNEKALAAVEKGDAAGLQKLIDAGADPKAVDKYGRTLLFDAGSPEVAELLMAHGVDLKTRDQSGTTALSSLCMNGDKNLAAVAKVLLQHGADPNSREGELKTTPIMGVRDGSTVDVLVQFGADVKAVDSEGDDALFWSTWQHVSVFEALLRHGMAFGAQTNGPTLLLHATWNGNLPLVTWFLAHGVDPNAAGVWVKNHGQPDMMSPMTAVAISGQPKAAKLLLEHGAKGKEAMALALQNHYSDIVKLLWDHGVRNISELCYAISQRAPLEELEKILQKDGAIDPPQDNTVSPLAEAVETDNLPVVKWLVAHGADVNRGGSPVAEHPEFHDTPLVLAAERGGDDIVAFLLQHGARPDANALYGAANAGVPDSFYTEHDKLPAKEHYERVIQLLLDAGAAKNITPAWSGNVLSQAISPCWGAPDPVVLQKLLAAGLSPEAPMPGLVERSEKANSVIGYCRDWYQKNQSHPMYQRPLSTIKEVLDMLETADKTTPVGVDATVRSVAPTPATTSAGGPLPVDNPLQQIYISDEMRRLTARLKLSPGQADALHSAMEAMVRGTATKTVDQALKEILNPQQEAAWEEVKKGARLASAGESAANETGRIAGVCALNEAQKKQVFDALYAVELKYPDSFRSSAEMGDVLMRKMEEKEAALAKILTLGQVLIYEQQAKKDYQNIIPDVDPTGHPLGVTRLEVGSPPVLKNFTPAPAPLPVNQLPEASLSLAMPKLQASDFEPSGGTYSGGTTVVQPVK